MENNKRNISKGASGFSDGLTTVPGEQKLMGGWEAALPLPLMLLGEMHEQLLQGGGQGQ